MKYSRTRQGYMAFEQNVLHRGFSQTKLNDLSNSKESHGGLVLSLAGRNIFIYKGFSNHLYH